MSRYLDRYKLAVGFTFSLALGFFLRSFQLASQILADDEWHALHELIHSPYDKILLTFRISDTCIPLTVYYKILSQTIGLSEWAMRFPLFLAGTASIVLFPYWMRRWASRSTAVWFSLLLAISPMGIYYSRFARPYALLCLLTFFSLICFYRWERSRDVVWMRGYIASVFLAGFLQLSILPFCFAPVAVVFLRERWERKRPFFEDRALWKGVAWALGLLAFVTLPPLLNSWGNFFGRIKQKGQLPLQSVWDAWAMHVGPREVWIVVLVSTLAVYGAQVFYRRNPRLCGYFLAACGFQLLALLILRPDMIGMPMVLSRYGISFQPVLWFFVAVSFSEWSSKMRPRFLAPVGLIGLLMLESPLWGYYFKPNQWMAHWLYQGTYYLHEGKPFAYEAISQPKQVSPFYTKLAQLPASSLTLVVGPYYPGWHNNALAALQKIARQKMRVALFSGAEVHARLGELPAWGKEQSFRNFVPVDDPQKVTAQDGDYLVLHKDIFTEVEQQVRHQFYRDKVDIARWVEQYRTLWGEPEYEDAILVAFRIPKGPQ